MTPSDLAALTSQLKSDEGLSLTPQRDAKDSLSIGYGRNLTFTGISVIEAELLLYNDIQIILKNLPVRWAAFNSLNGVRQQAIANMAYNLGVSELMQFSHFLAACARADWTTAGLELEQSAWCKQVGPRAYRIQKMIVTGEPPL